MRNLNLGSGGVSYRDAVNVDRVPMAGVDVVHDLDVFPWPFDDGRFDEVWASQLFEHVADPVAFMRECWRVLAVGGLLHIVTPYYKSDNAFTDPTHRRFCTERTFDYWIPGTQLGDQFGAQYAAGCTYIKEDVSVIGDDLFAYLRKKA